MNKNIKLGKVLLVSFIFLSFLGCQEQLSNFLGDKKALQQKINLLEIRVNYINDRLNNISEKIMKQGIDIIKLKHDVAYLDISEKGFSRIDTNIGPFFISLDDVKPFVNGYKFFLRIGNPYSVSFSSFEFEVEWGKKEPPIPSVKEGELVEDWSKKYDEYKISYSEWEMSLKNKNVSFSETLAAGTWNKVEMTISPAIKGELEHLKLKNMRIKKISMRIKGE
jgi:hypothetical protein